MSARWARWNIPRLSGVPINHYPGFIEGYVVVKLAAARANVDVGALKKD